MGDSSVLCEYVEIRRCVWLIFDFKLVDGRACDTQSHLTSCVFNNMDLNDKFATFREARGKFGDH